MYSEEEKKRKNEQTSTTVVVFCGERKSHNITEERKTENKND